ncbi:MULTISPECIES: hypothetical protein [unclassified Microbacterium]|uniref:hypothetical protein n=1 Tax=unclassified Microbacterium TaxID=2609290 RepID=UPI00109BE935|nr:MULTISPECIES: hypothetical protein [unclassified Microbacterium]
MQEVVDVDLHGSVSAVSTILLLQCVTASVDAFALLFDPKVGWNTDASLSVLAGGREDRAHMHPNGLWGYRVELDETLRKGQTGMVEYRVTHLREPPFRTEYATVVRHPVREITQSFRFDERWIPDWAMEIESGEKTRVESLVTGTSSLHRYRSSFGPGVLRVRWGRGDEVSS